MSYAGEVLRRGLRRVLLSQMLLTLGAAAVAVFAPIAGAGLSAALAVLYGGAVVLANTWHMARKVGHTAEGAGNSYDVQLTIVGGAALRFVFVLVAFAVGMGLLGLSPLALLAGFATAQLGYLVAVRG